MNRLRELENLLATKGTEAFWDVFEKVRALKAADVKALAREFSGASARAARSKPCPSYGLGTRTSLTPSAPPARRAAGSPDNKGPPRPKPSLRATVAP